MWKIVARLKWFGRVKGSRCELFFLLLSTGHSKIIIAQWNLKLRGCGGWSKKRLVINNTHFKRGMTSEWNIVHELYKERDRFLKWIMKRCMRGDICSTYTVYMNHILKLCSSPNSCWIMRPAILTRSLWKSPTLSWTPATSGKAPLRTRRQSGSWSSMLMSRHNSHRLGTIWTCPRTAPLSALLAGSTP